MGIPEDELPKIFQRFHRGRPTKARTVEGTGIGLALVQELVKLHGGSIGVESEVGRGTSFFISIPFGSAHLPADRIQSPRSLSSTALGASPYLEEALRWLPPADNVSTAAVVTEAQHRTVSILPSNQVSLSPGKSSGRILLADDNADMRDYLRRLLSENYEVEAVADGRAALEAARLRPPDLVISDVMMPEMNGLELVRQLRSDPALRTVPILLLSALAGEEARVEALEHGPDDYLTKPFGARELLARVQTHLRLAAARKQADESLRRTSARLEATLAATEIATWAWDVQSDRVTADRNLARLISVQLDEPIGLDRYIDAVHPEDRARVRSLLQEASHSPTGQFEADFRLLQTDGSSLWVASRGKYEFDEHGQPLRFSGVSIDITDRKRIEESYRRLAQSLETEVQVRTAELERQSEQLRELSSRLLQAQDEERRRIARELHDSAGQILAALAMNLTRVSILARQNSPVPIADADSNQQLVQQLSQEIRTMSYLLHPPLLDELGLAEALRWYIEGIKERSGLDIELTIADGFSRLPGPMELVMFRLVQESLTNIHRHSGSKRAFIRIQRLGDTVCLEVEDQGKGMSSEKLSSIQSQGSGVGIRGMRERVRHFGGHLQIHSHEGGTKLIFQLPVLEAPVSATEVAAINNR